MGEKPRIYGYMRAYDGLPDDQIRQYEQQLKHWAIAHGYELVAIRKELDKGSIAELTDLVSELNHARVRAVVVPSIEHFGGSRILQEHLWSYVVCGANAEVYEVTPS